jgi:hypothetical protein
LGGYSTDPSGNLHTLSSLVSYLSGGSYYARGTVTNDLQVGDAVLISSNNTNFNGYFTVTAATATYFDYLLPGNPGTNPTSASYGRLWQIQQFAVFDNVIDQGYVSTSAFAPYGVAAVNNNSDLPAGPYIYQSYVVSGNIIRSGTPPSAYSFGIHNQSTKSSIIQNNIIDATPANQSIFSKLNGHVKTFGNQTSTGTRVRSYSQSTFLYAQELEDELDLFSLDY